MPLETPLSETLDTRGMKCPMPVLRLRRIMEDIASGTEIIVLATDTATMRDIPAYCAMAGHELLSAEKNSDGELHFKIRKNA